MSATGDLPTGPEKARAVRGMFDRIASRYDLVNRVMTFGMDVGWRRRTVGELRLPGRAVVADLACGTGDLCTELVGGGLAPSHGDRRGQVGVGSFQVVAEDPGDRREREALAPERPHLADPLHVALVVPGDAALALGRWDEATGLVVADRVDRDVTRGRELLDAVPHER